MGRCALTGSSCDRRFSDILRIFAEYKDMRVDIQCSHPVLLYTYFHIECMGLLLITLCCSAEGLNCGTKGRQERKKEGRYREGRNEAYSSIFLPRLGFLSVLELCKNS